MSPERISRIVIPALLVAAGVVWFGGESFARVAFQLVLFFAGATCAITAVDVRQSAVTVGDVRDMQKLMVEMRNIKHFIEKWTADAGAWSHTASQVDSEQDQDHDHEKPR